MTTALDELLAGLVAADFDGQRAGVKTALQGFFLIYSTALAYGISTVCTG